MVACMGRCMPTWIVDQWNGVETENIWLIIGSAQNLGWWSTQQFEETLLIVQSPLYCIVFTEILTGLNFCQSKTWHWLLTLILAEMSVALFGGLLTGAISPFNLLAKGTTCPAVPICYMPNAHTNQYLFCLPKFLSQIKSLFMILLFLFSLYIWINALFHIASAFDLLGSFSRTVLVWGWKKLLSLNEDTIWNVWNLRRIYLAMK